VFAYERNLLSVDEHERSSHALFYHLLVQNDFLRKGSVSPAFIGAGADLARLRVAYQNSKEMMRPRDSAILITSMEVKSSGLLVIRKTIPNSIVARVDVAVTRI